MRMKKILLVTFLLISALAGLSYGQSGKLIFSDPTASGTLFVYNEILTVSVKVTFLSGDPANVPSYPINTLSFNYTVNGHAGEPLPVQSNMLVLPHQKTTTVNINIPVSNMLFQEGGGHVIIIWPVTSVPADIAPGSFQLPEMIYVTTPAQLETQPDIRPYPNPTTGIVNVEIPDKGDVFVVDGRGRCVVKSPGGTTRRSLDLGSLPPGSYTLVVRSGGKVIRRTIIKQ